MGTQADAENLRKAIQALDKQRPILGDAVVEAALAPLREKLASLEVHPLSEQRKLVSVLFSDLVGFTALSSRMDPEDVREVMNAYFQRWAACIKRQEGVVEKFIGDAVLAVFGLPIAHEDDPERSIRAALEMQKELLQLNPLLEEKHGVRLAMRVGINTGEVVVSLQGERQGEEFIIVGDMVNLASRLQSAAPAGGILITHATYRHVRGLFETSSFGSLQLKGVELPVQAYWVKADKPKVFRLGSRGVEGVETPMVGRQAEFHALKAAFHQVLEQKDRQIITLVGEAGLGKSRLLHEFEKWLDGLPQKIVYFRGRAHASNQSLPYSLVRDVFALRWQIQDSDPTAVVREKLTAGLEAMLGADEPGEMKIHFIARLLGFEIGESAFLAQVEADARSLHDQALAYLGEYFQAVGAVRPAVILLEDIQWADASSLDLIGRLDALLAGQPFLIAGTARPSLFERRPDWGQGFSFHTRLDLSPLERSASQALVAEILKKVQRLPPALLDLVVNTAEGNPFFVEELIKMLIEDEVILKEGDHWRVEEEHVGKLRVPPTLKGVLQARFDSLAPQQRSYLQRGAIIGRIFWDQAVASLDEATAARPEQEVSTRVKESLEHLIRRELIFRHEQSSFDETTEYTFKHALLRDVTYSSLLKRERRVFHGRAARWLELVTGRTHRSAEFTMLIAEHYENAGENDLAAAWYLRAGRAAAARFANSEALQALGKVLELSSEPDLPLRFTVLLAREKVYERLGKREEQLTELESLQAAARDTGDAALMATAALRKAEFAFQTTDYPGAVAHAQQAKELAERIHNLELAAQSSLLQAKIMIRRGELEQVVEIGQRALTFAGQLGLAHIEADSHRQLGLAAYYMGKHSLAIEHFGQAHRKYAQIGDRAGEAMALNNLGGALFAAGQASEAGQYYTRSLEICRAIGDLPGQGRALNNLGIIAVTQTEYAQAEVYYLQGLQIAQQVGNRSFEMSSLDNLGNLAIYRYHYRLAEQYQRQALKGARAIGDRVNEAYILLNQSRLYLSLGDHETAQRTISEGMELSQQLNDREGNCLSLINLSWCHRLAGDPQAALQTAEQALALAIADDYRSEQGLANQAAAQALYQAGRFAEAAGRFQQAQEIHQELGEVKEALYNLSGLARACLALGEIERAGSYVERVLEHIAVSGIHGFEQPGSVFLACYLVLQAAQNPRAGQVLHQAYTLLQETAAKIESASMRRSYLEKVPENRAIMEAWENARRLQ